jgi:LuxR family maltose regulon positive regulatory protein
MVTVGRVLFAAIGRWLPERASYRILPFVLVGTFLLTSVPDWLLGLATDLLLSGDPVRGGEYLDLLQRAQPPIAPDSGLAARRAGTRALRCMLTGQAAEAHAEALAARAMRADADDAARRLAAENIVAPIAWLLQGIARILCGDLDGADASLEDAVSAGEEVSAHEILALALCERSLVAIANREWSRAEALAGQASTVLRRARIEDSYATPLVSAVHARTALHRGDPPTVRQQLVSAQRLRHLLTYALPHVAVQARIELIRVHLALADLAGARTVMREVDDLLRRRPDLGTLVGETEALRAQLSGQRGAASPGASALTAAELRVVPLLATHLTSAEIATELFVSVHTVKSQQASLYRKLGTSSRKQAVARARQLGLLEG